MREKVKRRVEEEVVGSRRIQRDLDGVEEEEKE